MAEGGFLMVLIVVKHILLPKMELKSGSMCLRTLDLIVLRWMIVMIHIFSAMANNSVFNQKGKELQRLMNKLCKKDMFYIYR